MQIALDSLYVSPENKQDGIGGVEPTRLKKTLERRSPERQTNLGSAGYMSNGDLKRLWKTIADNAARMIRLHNYGIVPGHPADLVVLDACSIPEAVLHQADRIAVFKAGRLVAGKAFSSTVFVA